jgi:cation transport ATPase
MQQTSSTIHSLSLLSCSCFAAALQGALLLLLFRVSHLLEDRLTERAAGSLQRLFDSVPDTASVVEVDEGGAPRVATTQQVGPVGRFCLC